MAKVSTKRLIDEFFSELDEATTKKNRAHIDRPEVYAYEEKIGKQLMDMNADEIMDMIKTFGKADTNNDGMNISYNSYKQILVWLRSLFNMYIERYEIIINPMYNPKLKGRNAYEQLKQGKKPLTFDRVQEVIDLIYEDFPDNYYMPKYIELIMLLFYCGFATSFEILDMKKDMVDFQTQIVNLPNKKVHLSDRCVYLLDYFDKMKEVSAIKGIYYVVSWHDSYFKFFVRSNQVSTFDSRSKEEVAAMIVRAMTRRIRQEHGIDINYRKLYELGFYDYIVKQVGEEEAKELITAVRQPEKTAVLQGLMDEYGFKTENITVAKNILYAYI